jgi:putative NIF3 family GTP cyclohydrolase 1 type 2
MKVHELNEYLLGLFDLTSIGIDHTVDRIIVGDPNTKVTKIGVCWMPYLSTLREAAALGINTMVVHEPTFYDHWDNPPESVKRECAQKSAFIAEHRLAIIRCHDVLDAIPEWGMPFALGKAIGFTNDDIMRSSRYFKVYGLKNPLRAITAASRIAKKLRIFGQKYSHFAGDPDLIIDSVGVGTGYNCDPLEYKHLNAGLSIAITDRVMSWVQPVVARDSGQPLLVIEHGVSEEPGVIALYEHLRGQFKDIEFVHFAQGHSYTWV